MTTRLGYIALLLFTSGILCGADAERKWYEQFDGELKPELLTGSEDDIYVPAISFELQYRKDKSLNDKFTKTLFDYGFASEGTFATDSRANSEGLFAEVHGGVKHTFSEYGQTGTAPAPAPRPDAPMDMPGATEQIDLPFVHLSALVRFETDQIFENYSINYGPRIGIVHTRQDELTPWVLIPKLQLDYHRVDILHSRDFEERGIAEDSFWRFSAEADWRFEVGTWWAPAETFWHGLGLHGSIGYYQGFDMPTGADQANMDTSWLYSGGVHLRLRDSRVRWGKLHLHFVYLTLSNGRKPPVTRDQTSAKAGVAFSWNDGVY